VAGGHAVPVVEVVSPQPQGRQEGGIETGASGKRRTAGERGDTWEAEAGEEEDMRGWSTW
jgi:hypothetical protein